MKRHIPALLVLLLWPGAVHAAHPAMMRPASVVEGSRTVRVTLDPACDAPTVLVWRTADGSAVEGSDYRAANGSRAIDAGETVTFDLEIVDDRSAEKRENLKVHVQTSGAASASGVGDSVEACAGPRRWSHDLWIEDDDSAAGKERVVSSPDAAGSAKRPAGARPITDEGSAPARPLPAAESSSSSGDRTRTVVGIASGGRLPASSSAGVSASAAAGILGGLAAGLGMAAWRRRA